MNWYFRLNVTVSHQFMQPDHDKTLPLEIIFKVKVAQKKNSHLLKIIPWSSPVPCQDSDGGEHQLFEIFNNNPVDGGSNFSIL